MMELTYDEIEELKYEARHGDEWAQMKLDDYYDQFEEIPDPMTAEEELEYKKEMIELDTLYWMKMFENEHDNEYYF